VALALSSLPVHSTEDRRYDVVLFDMGFTLVYFEPHQRLIVQKSLRSVGAERSEDKIDRAIQVVWGDYYRDAAKVTFPATEEYDHQSQNRLGQGLLNELGLEGDHDALDVYTKAIEAWFSRPGVMRPYAEVVDVLTSLQKQGFRMGIVSNWSWNLKDRVAQVELDAFFEVIWASAYAGCNKPHPDIFRQALARMGASHERILYVGDSYDHDVVGARNADLDAVLLDRDGSSGVTGCPVISDLWGLFGILDSAG